MWVHRTGRVKSKKWDNYAVIITATEEELTELIANESSAGGGNKQCLL